MTQRTRDAIDFDERIIDIDVSQEIETSFLEYAYSVIYSRALPDARDGLKPVQRRILYTMHDMGLRPERAYVKCARVVGQVMGQLHPHGDSAIYEAVVRMAQDWSMRLTTVDGHGNFGSLDAGPAASRYTECRLQAASLALVDGIDEDTVDFRPNYDGKELEPSVLPAAWPHLLVNGASGIAVGMATNIAPHNLVEVVSALKFMLNHSQVSLDDIMRFIPGPDMPSGGIIVGLDGVRDAYESGRGTFKLRARTSIEKVSARRQGIIVTELPYGVGPEKIMEQIKSMVNKGKLKGIADVKDLSDLNHGTRLVIEVKNGINPEALLAQLYKHTKLEDSFAINAVALVDGQPRTMSLIEMLQVYLDHRIEVTRRRTRFQLQKATDRAHLVEGLLLALVDIDDVIAIIRSSDDVEQARHRLMEAFNLSEIQANYILDLQLRRLTRLSRIELENERDQLRDKIAELTHILSDSSALKTVIARELDEVAHRFGDSRRTVLLADTGAAAVSSAPLEIPDSACWVLLSSTGLLARIDEDSSSLPEVGPRNSHDVIKAAIRTTARSDYALLTNRGRLIKANAVELPSLPLTANAPCLQGGTPAHDLVECERNEKIIGISSLSETIGLAIATKNGVVKRVNPEVLASKDSWEIINLADKDEVIAAFELHSPADDFVFITSDAQLLRFNASLVRPQGRGGSGVAGIKLAPRAHVIFFGSVPAEGGLVITCSASSSDSLLGEQCNVKVSDFSLFPSKGRATSGVRCHRFLKGEDHLLLAWAGPYEAIGAEHDGTPVDLPDSTAKRDGSGSAIMAHLAAIGSRRLMICDPGNNKDTPAS